MANRTQPNLPLLGDDTMPELAPEAPGTTIQEVTTQTLSLDDVAPQAPVISKEHLLALDTFYFIGARPFDSEYGLAAIFTIDSDDLDEPHTFIASVADQQGRVNTQRAKLLNALESREDLRVGPCSATEKPSKFGKPMLLFMSVKEGNKTT